MWTQVLSSVCTELKHKDFMKGAEDRSLLLRPPSFYDSVAFAKTKICFFHFFLHSRFLVCHARDVFLQKGPLVASSSCLYDLTLN